MKYEKTKKPFPKKGEELLLYNKANKLMAKSQLQTAILTSFHPFRHQAFRGCEVLLALACH